MLRMFFRSPPACTATATALFLALATPQHAGAQSYCAAGSNSCNASVADEVISRVVFNTIDNSSNATSGGSGCYTDFTTISTSLSPGQNYPITVYNAGPNSGTDKAAVWIDWNQDGSFDSTEKTILTTNSSGEILAGNVTVPWGALQGTTRVRIRITWQPDSNLTPCGNVSYGEVEDYSATVLPATLGPCCTAAICTFTDSAGCGSGAFLGVGTTCSPNPCGGACCASGVCTLNTPAGCMGSYRGNGSTCSPNPCTGACCTTPTCSSSSSVACSGTYLGDGTACSPNPCGVVNDLCSHPTVLVENTPMPFDTTNATYSPEDLVPAPTCISATAKTRNDVWYRYTPTTTGIAGLTAKCSPTAYSLNILVYSSCGGTGQLLACANNNGGETHIPLSVTAGQSVHIRVAANPNGARAGTIEVTTPTTSPVNDTCDNAIDIVDDQIIPFSNATATSSTLGYCTPNLSHNFDLWYRYVPAQSGTAYFSTCGSAVACILSAYVGDVPCDQLGNTGPICGSDDASCPSSALLTVGVTAGMPIRIRVNAGATGVTGTGQIHAFTQLPPPPPPANDACSNATPIVSGPSVGFDTTGATNTPADVVEFCSYGLFDPQGVAASNDVWFSYAPAATGMISVTVRKVAEDWTPSVTVYNACGGGQAVACELGNLAPTVTPNTGQGTRVVAPVTNGQAVYIRVSSAINIAGGMDNTPRLGTIQVSGPSSPPANDNCADAIAIADGQTVSFSNEFATTSQRDNPLSCGTGPFEVWYRYVASQLGQVQFSTAGSTVPVRVVPFDDSCGGPLQCGGGIVAVTPGTAIRVRVSGTSGDVGTIQLHAQFVPAPTNDLCINALDVTAGDSAFDTNGAGTDGSTCVFTGWGDGTGRDVWYRFTPTVTGYADIRFVQWTTPEGGERPGLAVLSSCGGQQLSCQSDRARVAITNGQPILVRINVATYGGGGGNISGTFRIVEHTVDATQYFEGNTDVAGGALGFAADLSGLSGVTQILGMLQVNDVVDMYQIRICDPTTFSATTWTNDPFGQLNDTSGYPFIPRRLYLFNDQGVGVVGTNSSNEASYHTALTSGVTLPGVYYLAVSTVSPFNGDGQLLWSGDVSGLYANRPPTLGDALFEFSPSARSYTQPYVLTLTGTCACPADFNHSGTVSVQDIFDYLAAYFSGSPSADVNGSGSVSVQDIFDFLALYFSGCP